MLATVEKWVSSCCLQFIAEKKMRDAISCLSASDIAFTVNTHIHAIPRAMLRFNSPSHSQHEQLETHLVTNIGNIIPEWKFVSR